MKQVIKIIMVALCLAQSVRANRAEFWQKQINFPQHTQLANVAEMLENPAVKHHLLQDPTIKKVASLSNGAATLLKKGNISAAEQIIKTNITALDQGAERLRECVNCAKRMAIADTDIKLVSRLKLSEPFKSYLKQVHLAKRLYDQKKYTDAEHQADTAEQSAKIAFTALLQRVRLQMDSWDPSDIEAFGSAAGAQLRDTLKLAELCLTQKDFKLPETLPLYVKISNLGIQLPASIARKKSALSAQVKRSQTIDEALACLQPYLKSKSPSSFATNLKDGILANRRFALGQRLRNEIDMDLTYLPAGTFEMGSPASEMYRDSSELQHSVKISKGFFMGTREVTRRQWDLIMGTHSEGPEDFAKDNVSWEDAVRFCQRLSKQEKGLVYRLPTEAEWEYACRAGTDTPFNNGQNSITGSDAVIFDKNQPPSSSAQVESFLPNRWGLYDMHGNLAEWCQDWMGSGGGSPTTDPCGPPESDVDTSFCGKVIRGGSWIDLPQLARSASRQSQLPIIKTDTVGFRIVLNAETVDLK